MPRIRIYPENPDPRQIERAVTVLRAGGLVVYPTDTVYAIGCDALNTRAVERICRLKGINPQKVNLSVICYDLSNLSQYVKVEDVYFKLMKRNLPGPYTFILPTNSNLPRIYKSRKTVGIRVPDNGIIREIVRQLGNPVLTTSVREEGDMIEYTTDPELIEEKYDNIVDLIVDGGYGGYEPSTVVDCTGDEPLVIREGKGELIV